MGKRRTFGDEVREHNEKVKGAFDRAAKGEVINLTDLMISKENLMEKKLKKEGLWKV